MANERLDTVFDFIMRLHLVVDVVDEGADAAEHQDFTQCGSLAGSNALEMRGDIMH